MPVPAARHLRTDHLAVGRGGRRLVSGLDLEVSRGAFLAVTGPSGTGKTSLLHCLAGLLEPEEGSVTFLGRDGEGEASPRRDRIGIVFQQLHLAENATVETNVLCGSLGRHPWWRTALAFPRAEREMARDLIARMELGHRADRPVKRISGGEKQRVAMARALMQDPEILFADEPVSSLDFALARRVLAGLRDDARGVGRTVFCVLHDARLAAEFADHVLELDPRDPSGWTLKEPAP